MFLISIFTLTILYIIYRFYNLNSSLTLCNIYLCYVISIGYLRIYIIYPSYKFYHIFRSYIDIVFLYMMIKILNFYTLYFYKNKPTIDIKDNEAMIDITLPNNKKIRGHIPFHIFPSNKKINIDNYQLLEYRTLDNYYIFGLPLSCNHSNLDTLNITITSYPNDDYKSTHNFNNNEIIDWYKLVNNIPINDDNFFEPCDD